MAPTYEQTLSLSLTFACDNMNRYEKEKRKSVCELVPRGKHVNRISVQYYSELSRISRQLLPSSEVLNKLPADAHWHILNCVQQVWAHPWFLCDPHQNSLGFIRLLGNMFVNVMRYFGNTRQLVGTIP